jgi:hypothetical protein
MILKQIITGLILSVVMLFGATSINALSSMSASALSISTSSVVISNGLIGVGTPTPQYTLDVYGDFRVSSNITAGRGNIYSSIVTVNGTVDWSAGPYQRVVVGSGGVSVSFLDPSGPCTLWLIIQRTGAGVASFPDVIWINAITPSLATSESAGGTISNPIYDILELYYDGTNYYGAVYLNFKT